MKSKLGMLLACFLTITLTGYSSLPDDYDCNLGDCSLVMFLLEKNTLWIEEYNLDEIKDEVNYISQDMENSHCVYRLALNERGQKVTGAVLNNKDVSKVMILTQRGKNDIWYALHWGWLMMKDPADIQEFMRADCQILDVSISDGRKAHWVTKLSVAWGDDLNQLGTYLEFERKIETVCAVVVPNDLLKQHNAMFQLITKQELLDLGILKKVGLAKLAIEQEDRSCCVAGNNDWYDGLEAEKDELGDNDYQDECSAQDCAQCHQHQAWYVSTYYSIIGKLTALQKYMCDKVGILC